MGGGRGGCECRLSLCTTSKKKARHRGVTAVDEPKVGFDAVPINSFFLKFMRRTGARSAPSSSRRRRRRRNHSSLKFVIWSRF